MDRDRALVSKSGPRAQGREWLSGPATAGVAPRGPSPQQSKASSLRVTHSTLGRVRFQKTLELATWGQKTGSREQGLYQVTERCCGDAHASDSDGTRHATPMPLSPRPGWRPPPLPPAPRPHSPRLGPLALPPARSPRPAQQATGDRAGAGRAQEIPPLPGLSGAGGGGRGRRGPPDPRSCRRSPRGFAAPGAPPTACDHPRRLAVGWGSWGQEGWNPPLGLALSTDSQTRLDSGLSVTPSFTLAPPRWCCVKWAVLRCLQI